MARPDHTRATDQSARHSTHQGDSSLSLCVVWDKRLGYTHSYIHYDVCTYVRTCWSSFLWVWLFCPWTTDRASGRNFICGFHFISSFSFRFIFLMNISDLLMIFSLFNSLRQHLKSCQTWEFVGRGTGLVLDILTLAFIYYFVKMAFVERY